MIWRWLTISLFRRFFVIATYRLRNRLTSTHCRGRQLTSAIGCFASSPSFLPFVRSLYLTLAACQRIRRYRDASVEGDELSAGWRRDLEYDQLSLVRSVPSRSPTTVSAQIRSWCYRQGAFCAVRSPSVAAPGLEIKKKFYGLFRIHCCTASYFAFCKSANLNQAIVAWWGS
jgi:hypothetical protein